jgi:hypothetical protein
MVSTGQFIGLIIGGGFIFGLVIALILIGKSMYSLKKLIKKETEALNGRRKEGGVIDNRAAEKPSSETSETGNGAKDPAGSDSAQPGADIQTGSTGGDEGNKEGTELYKPNPL